MKIQWIKHPAIDKEKYDRCILDARNGTIYAMSWYLDAVASGWQLLATPDYSFVMPVLQKRKFGIPYVLQPMLCQQSGIFSPEEITKAIFEQFIKKIPAVYCILQLNPGNSFQHKDLKERPNYVLDLRPEYEEIKSRYHSNTRSDLKKRTNADLVIDSETDYVTILDLMQKHSLHYTGKILAKAKNVIEAAKEKNALLIRCVREKETMEIVAGVLFLRWKNRFYYIFPVSTAKGKEMRAMRFLIDRFIAEFAGQNYILDFEGSSIPAVARFYQNFGATLEAYPCYYKSKLPFIFRNRQK
ncbi:MAG: hypothetical protein LBO74_12080 [Candidatus Symbiothrix sp.]|jgi:hypothetical protein|nr:hypothetical protein [Candidatus Symbiothrix sp.]